VELLVVVAIIALLLGILVPSLGKARLLAKSTASMSNLRQLGVGVVGYTSVNHGRFPMHSSLKQLTTNLGDPRTRWADYIFPFMENTDVYLSPNLSKEEESLLTKPFAHTVDPGPTNTDATIFYGGYGYNYQYLGNARHPGYAGTYLPYHNTLGQLAAASDTVALADTAGTSGGGGTYVVDPPLRSRTLGSMGSRKSSFDPNGAGNDFYDGDGDSNRAKPAPRNMDKVNICFADGHAESMTANELDGLDADGTGTANNRYFNGEVDATIE
jgi:prepilin-type processing-associated H-X9-DG protein